MMMLMRRRTRGILMIRITMMIMMIRGGGIMPIMIKGIVVIGSVGR